MVEPTERCIACSQPFAPGDQYLPDVGGGFVHMACCGPERESYVDADGEPLAPDEPIPTALVWEDDHA